MFNADKIAAETISQVIHHMEWKYLHQLYFAPPNVMAASGQPHPLQQSPLREQIDTLCRLVNDKPAWDEMLAGEVMEITQSIAETLFSNPLISAYEIPQAFWSSDLGQLVLQAQLWARGDELIALKEAAEILRGSSEPRDLVWINDQIGKGKLTRYVDPGEANPQHAGRVSRAQVEGLKRDI